MPVEHVGLCCARGMDFRVPQGFAIQGVTRDQVSIGIRGEEQLARGRQQTRKVASNINTANARIAVTPDDLARLIVDSNQPVAT